jgi:hypothetical protein
VSGITILSDTDCQALTDEVVNYDPDFDLCAGRKEIVALHTQPIFKVCKQENRFLPSYICPTDICRSAVCPTNIYPNNTCPNGICPNGICPNGICPNRICPNDICQSRICPNGICPTDICPKDICQSNICRTTTLSGWNKYWSDKQWSDGWTKVSLSEIRSIKSFRSSFEWRRFNKLCQVLKTNRS